MKRPLIVRIYYFILTRRYILDLKGEDILKAPGPKLILPNHQSHIDPQLMAIIVAQHCDFVPVVLENFARIPVIGYFLKKWNAVEVSNLTGGNRDPDVLKKVFSQVIEAINSGRSVIIYPSGQITAGPTETIKNKQSAYVIVSSLQDEARIIGVRISGLWGSMWSVAWMGRRPKFLLTFMKGIFYFFANLIVFSPKRTVTFEFVDITEEARLKTKSDRRTFNTYLEEFYNINGPEEVSYIKHLFFFPKLKRKYPKRLKKA